MCAGNNNNKQGFTLVELAIVLVIIGLIIGGVLVGQDMIRSAEIRSTIGQYEKYNTAINTFRDKYRGIPGDLANATNFGFTASAAGKRNNNGQIEDCGSGTTLGCETALFWDDLVKAQLIGDNVSAGTAAALQSAASSTPASYLPAAKIGNGNLWQVFNSNGRNWYYLSAVSGTAAGTTTTSSVSPIVAFNIDSKVDDGIPSTGLVLSSSARGTPIAAPSTIGTATDCGVLLTSGVSYNTDNNNAGESDSPNCQLAMKAN